MNQLIGTSQQFLKFDVLERPRPRPKSRPGRPPILIPNGRTQTWFRDYLKFSRFHFLKLWHRDDFLSSRWLMKYRDSRDITASKTQILCSIEDSTLMINICCKVFTLVKPKVTLGWLRLEPQIPELFIVIVTLLKPELFNCSETFQLRSVLFDFARFFQLRLALSNLNRNFSTSDFPT